MIRRLRAQDGQALLLVLGFMVLAVPLITGMMRLGSSLLVDDRIKTEVLKRHYCALGSQALMRHALLKGTTPSGGRICSGILVTTTFELLRRPDPDLFPVAAALGRIATTKTVNPTSTSAGGTVTYTIKVQNNKSESVLIQKIVDEPPVDFTYAVGTSVMVYPTTTVISTDDPVSQIQVLVWTVPGGGVYCNEAWVEPGGRAAGTAKTAKVAVGSPTNTQCQYGGIRVSKTVDPAVEYTNTTTTYTYLIEIENVSDEVVFIKEIKDITSPGFTYEIGSTSSSPPSFAPGEPTTINPADNEIIWEFGGPGIAMAAGTLWFLEFQAKATLPRGFYPNEVKLAFAGPQIPTPSQSGICVFEDGALSVAAGSDISCGVGSNSNIDIGDSASIDGDVVSPNGNIEMGSNVTVSGDILTLNGNILVGPGSIVGGSVRASGNVLLQISGVVQGNVVTGGNFALEAGASIGGYIWAAGNVEVEEDVTTTGEIISGGNVTIGEDAFIDADIWAGGNVTLDSGAVVTGIIVENAVIPPAPPLDLESSGQTATVVIIANYRMTSSDGTTEYVCDLWLLYDFDIGQFDTVEGCSFG